MSNLDGTLANYVTTENLSRGLIDDQLAEPGRSAINNRAGGGFEIDAGSGDIMLFSGSGFRQADSFISEPRTAFVAATNPS